MTKNQINIQDQFLNRVRRDRSHVIIELTTGRKIEGVILGLITSVSSFEGRMTS